MDVYILWLLYFAGVAAIVGLRGGATHLFLVIKVAKIMLILLCLLWISLYLGNVLLRTYWLGAHLICLLSRCV